MFEREHHIRIATILQALNGEMLEEFKCLFGGGTAITLSKNEYRESADLDFLVSDLKSYRKLRELITEKGLVAITRSGSQLETATAIRSDQYGIRTLIRVASVGIKFEIVLEGRIALDPPRLADRICGIATLTPLDLGASKLLANSDRWSDDSTFSRDLIDLAMLALPRPVFKRAITKASGAYGESVERDLKKAIQQLKDRPTRLDECMAALQIESTPKALLWKRIRALQSGSQSGSPASGRKKAI